MGKATRQVGIGVIKMGKRRTGTIGWLPGEIGGVCPGCGWVLSDRLGSSLSEEKGEMPC
jgi:hypothetical protein